MTARRLLRAEAVGILLAPSTHDWRALGPAGAEVAAAVDVADRPRLYSQESTASIVATRVFSGDFEHQISALVTLDG
jgi:hypothetical protein